MCKYARGTCEDPAVEEIVERGYRQDAEQVQWSGRLREYVYIYRSRSG